MAKDRVIIMGKGKTNGVTDYKTIAFDGSSDAL